MTENPQEASKTETAAAPEHQQTEGEMVIELLKTFQADLKTTKEENQALRDEIKLLNDKVNKELPAQLDRAFKDIGDNFTAITNGIAAIPRPQQIGVAAAAAQKEGGGIGGIVERIIGAVEKGMTGGESGTLSDFDKEILKTSKQIQMITLKDVLKRTSKAAGIELAEHVVVNP